MPWLQCCHAWRRLVVAVALAGFAMLVAVPAAASPVTLAAATADGTADEANDPADDEADAEATAEPPPARTELVEHVEVSSSVAKDREDAASFSDLDREEIEARHRGQDLGMLLGDSPSAYAYSDAGNGVGYSTLRLRGFDQTRIAVNVNGVPLNTPESRQVYYIDLADFAGDLALVQVQRGPGTALYGSPAVGGAVNLETGQLDPTPGGHLVIGAGSYGTYRASIQYGGPLAAGRWAWSARFAHVQSDGYRDPSWTRHSIASLALQRFGESSIWRILLFGGPEKTQLAYFGVPREYLRGEISGDADRDRRVNFLLPGETDEFVQPQLQIHNDRRLADGVFLRNTWYAIVGRGAYRQHDDVYQYDPLGGDPPTATYPEATLSDTWRYRAIYNRQVGWIPRIDWDHRGGTLSAGAEALFHEGRHRGKITSGSVCVGADPSDPCAAQEPITGEPTLYGYDNHKDTINLFVRETIRPSPQLAIHLELQGTHHKYAMRDDTVRGYSFDADYTFATPRLGANWNIGDRWNVYAQAATGRSEPVFSNVWNPQETEVDPQTLFENYDPAARSLEDPLAQPEKLRSFDAGAGYRYGSTRLKVNVYRMEFRDELVFAGGIDDDGIPRTQNAGRSIHQGVELEAAGRLPGEIDLGGYASFSHDLLEDYSVYAVNEDGSSRLVDYSGNRVALFPDSIVRLRAGRLFGPVRLELGARRVGTIYTDNSEDDRLDPVAASDPARVAKKVEPTTLVDLRATLDLTRMLNMKSGSLGLSLWVDNLLDHRYETIGYSYPDPAYSSFYTEFFPGAPRNAFFSVSYGF